jgi:hypothetical protein
MTDCLCLQIKSLPATAISLSLAAGSVQIFAFMQQPQRVTDDNQV